MGSLDKADRKNTVAAVALTTAGLIAAAAASGVAGSKQGRLDQRPVVDQTKIVDVSAPSTLASEPAARTTREAMPEAALSSTVISVKSLFLLMAGMFVGSILAPRVGPLARRIRAWSWLKPTGNKADSDRREGRTHSARGPSFKNHSGFATFMKVFESVARAISYLLEVIVNLGKRAASAASR
ncbi:MAG: hypothetical protein AAF668_15240 [Pseudomonadota bacterium]